ncbi:SDR family NAD(P)-dependent oxidoreductase [Streptomyces poonensis]|uniref:3-oxoacyl-ACP reductase n=1 Tax=Streptomyces poonensis TaxID=68255 RepID=A0A918UF18_9ACTN|nr:SDR family oxidoreductase [Streptomyces poonensis]GGY98831.1 3-oxoacyl-ACP reductase [Streptomyces poonensis]
MSAPRDLFRRPPDKGRVAVVSGGSRGLGRVLVERLLADGWRVATFSRKANGFTEATAEKHQDSFHWAPVDLTDSAALRSFGRDVVLRFGRLDLLVNNARVLHQELFLTAAPGRIEALVGANLLGPLHLTQVCARVMVRSGGGSVVNISTVEASLGCRGVAVHAAAKAGLEGLGRSLARELGPLGIRVNSLSPALFDSDMTGDDTSHDREKIQHRSPLRRLRTVDEVADAVLLLASPQAGFITGQTWVIDGGVTR